MIQSIIPIKLDVSRIHPIQPIMVKQLDSESRFIKATILSNGVKIEVPLSSTVMMNVYRKDNQKSTYIGSANEDGTVTVKVPSWLMAVDGISKCSITIIDANERKLTTLGFNITVETAEYTGEDIPPEDADLVVQLISQVSAINGVAIEAKNDALLAQAAAEYAAGQSDDSAQAAAGALSDFLGMLGVSVPELINGKIPTTYLDLEATFETVQVNSVNDLVTLTPEQVQKNDLAYVIEAIDGVPTITGAWRLLGDGDPSISANWIVSGTSYAVKAGEASIAISAGNSERWSGMRGVTMTQEQYDLAESIGTIVAGDLYIVDPEEE